ncbi:rhomboid family intramembrane serine protease [Nakamurella sp. YIM 132087]|uniref:Rhomboid family intramembrane serine protease n=1 Tax=Nakamurella alba TaxID=2665158 RepID=A0A7K1FKG7_9ACTN|nr:rhomboid family intramembrane serine protease [Nakamurella alba]MTD13354.1 rhomboid family intramembrane serine protease [Nakamurella alba]
MSSLPLPSDPAPVAKAKDSSSLMPAVKPAAITVGAFAVVLVVVQVVNALMSYKLGQYGIVSRTGSGLLGIVTAPFLHGSWGHLLSNLVPLVVFGFLIMVGGVRQFVAVTILVWLISGFGVWLFGPSNAVTVGASGLVFGWLAYLVARGVFNRSVGQILLGVLLLAIWGGIFWTGIISVALSAGETGISWQGHLFGAIGGVLAAFLVAKADGPRRPKVNPAAAPQLPTGF